MKVNFGEPTLHSWRNYASLANDVAQSQPWKGCWSPRPGVNPGG